MKKFFKAFPGAKNIRNISTISALVLIRSYQLILSPILAPACRFYPTCSDYAYQSILRYGFLKGFFLALSRLIKCHPFHPGGIDHVP